ncbi:hypothetical protein CDL12_11445 [Handroanthus impetiginosus]|uniref:Uncharacterized protein n=1 Tax=Handroanthus impetiginosus TaxID=429701 RepID=A0A2G9HF48_9LAMI|nr:hypothetical protein CDL12_11445 [Handroanthus impetiginosus]
MHSRSRMSFTEPSAPGGTMTCFKLLNWYAQIKKSFAILMREQGKPSYQHFVCVCACEKHHSDEMITCSEIFHMIKSPNNIFFVPYSDFHIYKPQKSIDFIKSFTVSNSSQILTNPSFQVHQSSTDAASSLLVTALNEGRDVIMDGTLSWVPFVVQTITMTRNVHRRRYRMGAGYKTNEDGVVTENYWEQIDEEQQRDGTKKRRPYRIELVGVVCDAYLAVIRGIRRALICRRAVRVNSQLKSHKRFADAFTTYCQLVDNARLYCTNALEGPPKLIGWKEKDKTLLVDPDEISCLNVVGRLNEEADSIFELYKNPHPAYKAGSVWTDIVLSPSRLNIQKELKYSIQNVERLRE